MKFVHETGAIIAMDGSLISIFDGHPGHVDFPDEMIQKIHRLHPGYIQRFTHTHPPFLSTPSERDHIMMRNLAFAMYPFPVRLGIIVPQSSQDLEKHIDVMRSGYFSPKFIENVWQWVLEPSEIWKQKKMIQNDAKRNIVFERVESRIITYEWPISSWENWIIERSYNEL